MNWVDVLVVLIALLVAMLGARQGLVVALPAVGGLLAGAVLAVRIAPPLVARVNDVAVKAALSGAILVLLAAFGEMIGVLLGRKVKDRIRNRHLAGLDNALGALLQAAMVFVVAWLFVLPLTSIPRMPGLASAVNGSTVLGTVNSIMPNAARRLPSELRNALNVPDLPTASDPFTQTPITNVGPPNTALRSSAVVRRVRPSVLKIRGRAPSCSRALEGSGFVISPDRVLTNAHVVAGTDAVSVVTVAGRLPARVVLYNPEVDVAVLSVPGLDATPLRFVRGTADPGDDAIVLGYPLDGPYTASAAKVRQRIRLDGPDIYDARTVTRDVYTVRGTVRSGNSGGPMIDPRGRVIGVVFGAAVDDADTGFVLTNPQVSRAVRAAPGLRGSVGTGNCAT
ncbi:MAG: MarP family serine protease [Sciscionella sp.]